MACAHEQFIVVESYPKSNPAPPHTKVVCAYCGHVRTVYADGTIRVEKEEGQIKR